MKIYKYTIPMARVNHDKVNLPVGYKILTAQIVEYTRSTGLCIWCEVDPEKDVKPVKFRIYATGQELEKDHDKKYDHVCTQLIHGYVWHIYVEKEITLK